MVVALTAHMLWYMLLLQEVSSVKTAKNEVYPRKVGYAVTPFFKEKAWETFLAGVNSFPEDFMAEGRVQREHQERESIE